MSALSTATACPVIPVSDMDRARAWWVDLLGMSIVLDSEAGLLLEAGNSTQILLYVSDGAGKAPNSIVEFHVTDIVSTVDSLSALGLGFERYEGLAADDRCIADMGPMRCAWITDPDGNSIAISQVIGVTA